MQSLSRPMHNGQFIHIPKIQGHNDDEGNLFTLNTNCNSDADTRNYTTSTINPALFHSLFFILTCWISSVTDIPLSFGAPRFSYSPPSAIPSWFLGPLTQILGRSLPHRKSTP